MSFITIPVVLGNNTGLGYLSLANITSLSSGNTALGKSALFNMSAGTDNTAIGENALQNLGGNGGNTAVGKDAIKGGGAGNSSAFGAGGVLQNVNGTLNAAFGYGAGSLLANANKNSIFGSFSGNQGGLDIRNLSNYIVLSDGDGNPRLWIDNAGLVNAPGGFAGVGGGITLNNRTSTYNIVASDAGKAINCTSGTFTVSTDPAATLGSGFACFVWNTGTGTITINPNGAETIDGLTTLVLRQGEGTQIVCDGANWLTGSKKTMRAYAENIPTGSIRPSASGASGIAIGEASSSAGSWSVAIGYAASAGPSFSLAIGANSGATGSQTQSGSGAVAIGGSYASGTDSFSAAIGNNTSSYGATGANSIAIGVLNQSQSNNSIAIGDFSTASATNSTAIGSQCSASAFQTIAIGNSAKSQTIGKYSYASGNFGSSADICQEGKYILRCVTTNATATVLTTDNTAPGSNDQIILQNNTAYAFVGTVVARQQASGGTQSAAWKIEGLIRREANAATTTLVASTVTVISNAPGWTLALSADTANGGLAITATGAVGTNIRWVATAATSEVNYA